MIVSRFRLLFLISLILLTFFSVTTASAAKPEVETFHDEGSFVVVDCGSFLALEDFVEDVRVTTFFDNTGNPVRVEVRVNYNGILTNSVTGKTLRDPGHYKIATDLQAGTQAFIGLVYAITVPGEGIAVLDAGRVVFDGDAVPENVIFEAGPHQVLHGGDEIICAALD